MENSKPSYGLDAPKDIWKLITFFFVASIAVLLSFLIPNALWFWASFSSTTSLSLFLFGLAIWTIYSSKISKPKIISQLVQELNLLPEDKVLDLGCGKGIFLIEAAKMINPGNGHGVDLWIKEGSKSLKKTAEENAKVAGVLVQLQTGDLRSLPYPDDTFDVVVSSFAIHSIKDECGRDKALFEMLRVLKPGGRFFLLDTHYGRKYAEFLKDLRVTCSKSKFFYCPPIHILKGTKPKHTFNSFSNKTKAEAYLYRTY